MKLNKTFLFLVFFPLSARADLAVSKWSEVTQLTESGKKTVISIEGQVKNVPQDQAMSAFSISFDEKQNISIIDASSEGKPADYETEKNTLKITFPRAKLNGQMVSLKFSYEEKYEKVNQYLRQEVLYVPEFAAGAAVNLMIIFPGYELTTYTRNLLRNGSNLTYASIAPKDGIKEVIKFTRDSATWNVEVNTAITSDRSLEDFSLRLPKYFYADRQMAQEYRTNFSTSPILRDRKGDDITYSFRVSGPKLNVTSEAKIFTGAAYRKQVMRNMINYSKITDEERQLLTPLLQGLRSNSRYAGLPSYVAIGEFVHEFIKYDKSYIGKLPSLREVVENKIGVCTEYAKLYDALARLSGIPSLIIDGAACGEYDQCQGHSWNMIFYNGSWIEVDPTWNLMSGVVSSSHIYTNDDGKGDVQITYSEKSGKVSMAMDLKMWASQ